VSFIVYAFMISSKLYLYWSVGTPKWFFSMFCWTYINNEKEILVSVKD